MEATTSSSSSSRMREEEGTEGAEGLQLLPR